MCSHVDNLYILVYNNGLQKRQANCINVLYMFFIIIFNLARFHKTKQNKANLTILKSILFNFYNFVYSSVVEPSTGAFIITGHNCVQLIQWSKQCW